MIIEEKIRNKLRHLFSNVEADIKDLREIWIKQGREQTLEELLKELKSKLKKLEEE
jgi:hypothetical protein